ncbi:LemA family protein [Leeia aquatica]|uniref:Lipoprotein n=1 Tax=Leeia aquatica TaxID=2725557 RepID=A0A847SDA9_9NEIS|nr:LemA family protein [Leeia aquatica]NLR76827.1 hypothetical protein [Leeia aquatica]
MRIRAMRGVALALLLSLGLAGCGFGELRSQHAATERAWRDVVEQDQRWLAVLPKLLQFCQGKGSMAPALVQLQAYLGRVPNADKAKGLLDDAVAFQQYQALKQALHGTVLQLGQQVQQQSPDLLIDPHYRDWMWQARQMQQEQQMAWQHYRSEADQFNQTADHFPKSWSATLLGLSKRP